MWLSVPPSEAETLSDSWTPVQQPLAPTHPRKADGGRRVCGLSNAISSPVSAVVDPAHHGIDLALNRKNRTSDQFWSGEQL